MLLMKRNNDTCPQCDGTGYIEREVYIAALDEWETHHEECKVCEGESDGR